MIATAVTGLMWVLVVSLLILRRGRSERDITNAALTIAIATTLNVDVIYRWLDGVVGGMNLITLGADLLLMVGVFFLGRGVVRASSRQPRVVRLALSRLALSVALACEVAAFVSIDRGRTTTNFMLDLGDQIAAGTYSAIQFIYYGAVLSAMASLAGRQLGKNGGIRALPALCLVAGSIFGVLLAVVVLWMDVAHLAGDLSLMTAVSVVYSPLYLLTFIFLCAGFASQPAARTLHAYLYGRRVSTLVEQLAPVWAKAVDLRPGISQHRKPEFVFGGPETVLHRQAVEIRDAMIDTRVSFAVSERELELLEDAERLLLGTGSKDSGFLASSQTDDPRRRRK